MAPSAPSSTRTRAPARIRPASASACTPWSSPAASLPTWVTSTFRTRPRPRLPPHERRTQSHHTKEAFFLSILPRHGCRASAPTGRRRIRSLAFLEGKGIWAIDGARKQISSTPAWLDMGKNRGRLGQEKKVVPSPSPRSFFFCWGRAIKDKGSLTQSERRETQLISAITSGYGARCCMGESFLQWKTEARATQSGARKVNIYHCFNRRNDWSCIFDGYTRYPEKSRFVAVLTTDNDSEMQRTGGGMDSDLNLLFDLSK